MSDISTKQLLQRYENRIVLGGENGATCGIRCTLCDWRMPMPPLPLDAEVWGLAIKASARNHAITHLIDHAQTEKDWGLRTPECGYITSESNVQEQQEKANISSHIPVEDITDSTCPKCGSDDVVGDFIETGDGVAIQELYCTPCGCRWKNIYDFAAVYLIDEGEDGLVIDIPRSTYTPSGKELGESTEVLRVANEDLRHELEVVYGQNADLERQLNELQHS